ncbi:MAG: hypothetical protein V4474_00165 [Patescibacteria group bacterium]
MRIKLFDLLGLALLVFFAHQEFKKSSPKDRPPTTPAVMHRDDTVASMFEWCKEWCSAKIPKSVGEGFEPVEPDRDVFKTLLGCDSMPCHIIAVSGGDQRAFALMGTAALLHPTASFVINGYCASGCTIFADIARERICLGPRAALAFHQGYKGVMKAESGAWVPDPKLRFIPHYSADIDAWVQGPGKGYPTEGAVVMPLAAAAKIWRECLFDPPLPRRKPSNILAAVK